MNLRPLFVFLPSAALSLALAATLASTEACGNSVADCNAACPSPLASSGCSVECTQFTNACTAANDLADLQALLTCVTNSGNALDPLPVDCQTQYNTVEANCQGTGGSGTGGMDSGQSSGTGSSTGTGSGSTGFTCSGSFEGTCPEGEFCCGGEGGFGYECIPDNEACPL